MGQRLPIMVAAPSFEPPEAKILRSLYRIWRLQIQSTTIDLAFQKEFRTLDLNRKCIAVRSSAARAMNEVVRSTEVRARYSDLHRNYFPARALNLSVANHRPILYRNISVPLCLFAFSPRPSSKTRQRGLRAHSVCSPINGLRVINDGQASESLSLHLAGRYSIRLRFWPEIGAAAAFAVR